MMSKGQPRHLSGKALVVGKRLNATRARALQRPGRGDVARQAQPFADRLLHELQLLAGRRAEMDQPIEVGLGEGCGRQAEC